MKNKIFIVTFIITIAVLAGIGWQSFQDNSNQVNLPTELTNNPPILSTDQKSIVSEDKVIFSIDDDPIFNWFKSKSQLCDESNISSTPNRKMFCENKQAFREDIEFSSIEVSPDKKKIGFTIISDSYDTVVGIYHLERKQIEILSDYYLGNEFISFSPSGKYFIYRGRCWEAMCGLFVKDTDTLKEKAKINDPEYVDYRQWDAEFIRWISDNEVEYRLKSINSDETKIERKLF